MGIGVYISVGLINSPDYAVVARKNKNIAERYRSLSHLRSNARLERTSRARDLSPCDFIPILFLKYSYKK